MSRFLLALGILAGCAAPPALLESAPPASVSPETSVSPEAFVSLAPLAQAPQPVLPAPLRRSASGAMPADHAAMGHAPADHAATGHAPMPPEASGDTAAAPSALGDALDAYLAIQSALARDAFEGVADHALAFADAWRFAAEEAPEADPHFWHTRSAEVDAVETHAIALADAEDLDAVREAFGALSATFVRLVEAHGAPAGYDLSRFSCGMRSDLPEGGVWLQRGAETQNPYFGPRMLACGTRGAAVPARADDVRLVTPEATPASGAMPAPAMSHETMDHSG